VSSLPAGAAGFLSDHRIGYPERNDDGKRDWRLRRASRELRAVSVERFATAVSSRQRKLAAFDDAQLAAGARRAALDRSRGDAALAELFAHVREAARRSLGIEHFAVQLAAGAALLKGQLTEMATGEGKTLSITLAAAAMALRGVPVHVITVNDYLARRDAAWMEPIYRLLGLSVGVVTADADADSRRLAYRCDLTYCSNKELVFDFLRDRQVLGNRRGALELQFDRLYGRHSRSERLLLPGLCFGIVDEADSVLVDETRTPLILSRRGDDSRHAALVAEAIELAPRLREAADYVLRRPERRAELTAGGRERLRAMTASRGPLWRRGPLREELLMQALAALHLYRRDHDYIVRDGQVVIVDEHTGRAMPGRSWSRGLHAFVEAKEGCEVTPEPETLARISYQRFFRRYLGLAGTTGTAREVARELSAIYDLGVVQVPPRKRCRRKVLPEHVFATIEDKWRHVVDRIATIHATGQPVLAGTSSVAASETLSAMLSAAGLEHRTLNARQDHEEAEIIALAGQQSRITVATNMAGRGTDIRLAPGITALGGLHVIVTERHSAARIDRQLIGRCARQGDPGSAEMILSLEDAILDACGSPLLNAVARWLARSPRLTARFGGVLLRAAQRRVERLQSRRRRQLVEHDSRLDSRLAFSGRPD
jgi:preprotein translocase subunit SecA